MQQEKETI